MAFKNFVLANGQVVTIYKRRSSRHLRLSIAPTGEVRVSIPVWAPYSAGLTFAQTKQAWIDQQQPRRTHLQSGQPIGKAHHLKFVPTTKLSVSSRIKATEVIIAYPTALAVSSPAVQTAAEAAGVRALRQQAEALLPQRLERLAKLYGFQYHDVAVKRLKSRWGSCDAQGHIVLNLFLMQLPWECIDYVLLHELVHTQILRHGPDFWGRLQQLVPDLPAKRKLMRNYQPILHSPLAPAVT